METLLKEVMAGLRDMLKEAVDQMEKQGFENVIQQDVLFSRLRLIGKFVQLVDHIRNSLKNK